MPEHSQGETDRAHELRIARALRQSLDTIVRAEGGMASDAAMAACTEFWVQVFTVAHIQERLHYPPEPWDVIEDRLTSVLEAMQTAVRERLRRAWALED
jgi:hypothetical protein